MIRNKISFPLLAMSVGTIAGLISACLTWNLIYAIGSRVIEDQEYCDYEGVINASGAFGGAVLGLALGLGTRRPVVTVLTAHAIAPVLFFLEVFPLHSWRDGIAEHFITIYTTAILCAVAFHLSTDKKRPTSAYTLSSRSAPKSEA